MRPMPFVDRDGQVDAVLGYAAEADAGTGRLVLVEGEAGVGKSTLLEQVEARLPGATWHWGACDGLFAPLPLAPLRDIAEDVGGALLAACRADAPRQILFAALLDTVRQGPGLTVLVVEDVHWADEATLDLLRHTGRRISKERVLLLVTFRGEETGTASGPLRQALGELSRQRATRRITLPALSPRAVRQLVAGTPLDADEVHALTGGNPFFVAEIMRSDGTGLPASARDAVMARVSPLDPGSRRLLDAAALAGSRVDLELMDGVVGEVPNGYDTLLGAGLLVADGRALRFRHEIARLAVADAVAEPRRTDLHRALLATLVARGVDEDARLTFHAEGAGDTVAVRRHATAAAQRAASLAAHHEAAGYYRRALGACDDTTEARTRAELLDSLANELGLVDHWEEARAFREEALELWRSISDPLREGEALRMQVRALWRLARGAEANAMVEQALQVLEPLGPTPELARTVKDRASTYMVTGAHPEALEAADRASALAALLDLPDVLCDALDTKACSLWALGQEWVPTMQQALEVGLAGGCDDQVARVYTNYYSGLVQAGGPAAGERLFTEGMAFCADHEMASAGNCLLASRVEALEMGGRWDEAAHLGWSHLETTTVSPINWMSFMVGLGRIKVRRGEPDAGEILQRAMATAQGTTEPQWLATFGLLLTEFHWVNGRLPDARRALETARTSAQASDDVQWLGPIAVWSRRLALPDPTPAAVCGHFAAELGGDVHGAVEGWEDMGAPYEAALALAFSDSTADRVDAVRRLDALGALAVAARVRKSLRERGIRSLPGVARSSTRDHPAGLTTREQEVLELLGRGLTNDEIAAALVISTKTAGHHVSAVLAKLGVANRRDAVAHAVRAGLLSATSPAPDDQVESMVR